jgi:L-malate glycosyltransferase
MSAPIQELADPATRAIPHVARVFLMINSLETGGTERQFVTLAQALDRNQFPVQLGCLKREGTFLEEVGDIETFSPGGSLFLMRSWAARIALARHLRTERVAVAHAFDFYANMMLVPAARMARVPVVIGSHRQLGDLMTPLQFRAQAVILRWCDKVICNSLAAANSLRKAGFKATKLEVIPNGLPERSFQTVLPAIPRAPGVLRVGMVSRMNDPGKNHDVFLCAAAQLATRHPGLRFVLAGDGPLREGLEALAHALQLDGRVDFLGEARNVPAVFASLDISVLPSRSESLSNVILESMAAGVPVVATDVGGNPELIREGLDGLLVPLGDTNALAAAIEKLVTNPELRARLGRQARESVLKEYRVEEIRDQYQNVYRSLLARKAWKASPAVESK